MAYAEPIAVATSADDEFGIDPDRVIEAWEPGVKVLLLNFPTNPTGGVTEKAKRKSWQNLRLRRTYL